MKLPEIELDDRRFDDLVTEARSRIARSCPEWTDHNASDPGVTLIELFAWMTEMTIYRLNRVPDKLHVALLDLLGIKLDGPTAAQTRLRFRLAEPPADPVEILGGVTEVGTPRSPNEDPVVFQVDDDFTIPPLRPAAYVLQRGGQVRDVGLAEGEGRPQGADALAFGTPPQVGDALCLGFERPLGRLLMQVDVDASQARGAGVDPEDPPLRWEVSLGDNRWQEAVVLEDLTGGFNYGAGTIELQVPEHSRVQPLAGHRMHWLRCRIDDRTRHGGAATTYSHAPEIYRITAAPIGALLPATHAGRAENDVLGVSDGTPAQSFPMRFRPVLKPRPGESLEIQDPDSGGWTAWSRREDFAESGADDRHYVLHAASGEVEFGPAIRERDGGWTQYGAIPPRGGAIRFTRYRHGGGRRGNVASGRITAIRTPVTGVDTVVNPEAAVGGVDAEDLTRARQRAAMEIRSRHRAVTAEDFEFLAGEASARVARAVCMAPQDGEAVTLRIVPHVHPADRALTYAELTPDDALLEEVAAYLDSRRLIGTTVQLLPCRFQALSVVVDVAASPLADRGRVTDDVAHALYTFLNPLVGGSVRGIGTGWRFGRPLNQGELFGIVHAIDGVEFVRVLRIYETDLATGEQSPKPVGSHIALAPDQLLASGQHIVKVTHASG